MYVTLVLDREGMTNIRMKETCAQDDHVKCKRLTFNMRSAHLGHLLS